jgi:membrane protease YdiL (CAAX protease family)
MTRRSTATVLAFLLARGVLLACAASLLLPAQGGIFLNVVIVAVDMATIAAIVVLIRRQQGNLRSFLGPFCARRDLPVAGLTMFGLFIGLTLGAFIGNAIIYAGPPPMLNGPAAVPIWLGVWSILVMPITVAIAEELLYRGWAHEQLLRVWRSWIVVVVIAITFGLQHAPLSATSPGDAAVRVIATMSAGLILGFLRQKGASLWALMIGHWAFDVVGLGLPALMTSLT